MTKKYLFELTVSELKAELETVGISGLNSESEAVIKLTIHLVSVGEDPFMFKFKPFNKTRTDDVPLEVEENIEGGPKDDCEVMIVLGQLPVANDVAVNAKVDKYVKIEASEDMPITAVDAFEEVREGNVVPCNASEDKFVDDILSVSVDLLMVEIEDKDNLTKVTVFASDIDDSIDSVNSSIKAVFGTCEKVTVSVPEIAVVESVVTLEETENGDVSGFLTASLSTSLTFSRVSQSSSFINANGIEASCTVGILRNNSYMHVWPPDVSSLTFFNDEWDSRA